MVFLGDDGRPFFHRNFQDVLCGGLQYGIGFYLRELFSYDLFQEDVFYSIERDKIAILPR